MPIKLSEGTFIMISIRAMIVQQSGKARLIVQTHRSTPDLRSRVGFPAVIKETVFSNCDLVWIF